MKKIFLIKLVLFLILGNCYSQGNKTTSSLSDSEEKKVVLDIREKFKEIENNYSTKYKRVEKELNDYSTEGGVAELYYDNDLLRKVITSFYGETGKVITEYFLWGGQVFFIYEREFIYNMPMYMESYDETKTEVIENRFYFEKENLIRWIDKDHKKVDKISTLFIKKQAETTEEIKLIKSNIF